jgi:hypothetical protein
MATLGSRRLMLKEALKARLAPQRRETPGSSAPVQITPRTVGGASPEDAF